LIAGRTAAITLNSAATTTPRITYPSDGSMSGLSCTAPNSTEMPVTSNVLASSHAIGPPSNAPPTPASVPVRNASNRLLRTNGPR
jgi:hypothetical protein